MEKMILDATSGYRQIWFNKDHPNAIYFDQRTDEQLLTDRKMAFNDRRRHPIPGINIRRFKTPTIHGNFKQLPYPNCTFDLVVFDPPFYTRRSKSSWVIKQWGSLNPETWQHDIKTGFTELYRVLKDRGILIMKWNNKEIKLKDVLTLIPIEPLFGHRFMCNTTRTKRAYTFWLCFMKIPSVNTK